MKKVILILAALVALAIPASASAITGSQAYNMGYSQARADCGRAWDWTCYYFPGYSTWNSCAVNRYCVWVWYGEYGVGPSNAFSTRQCYTETHYAGTTGALTYHIKSCP